MIFIYQNSFYFYIYSNNCTGKIIKAQLDIPQDTIIYLNLNECNGNFEYTTIYMNDEFDINIFDYIYY